MIKGAYDYRKSVEKYSVDLPKAPIETRIPVQVLTLSTELYTNKTMMELKHKLNTTKSLIDKYALSDEHHVKWEKLSNEVRIVNMLKRFVKTKMNGQFVSRAWLKLYELHSKYKTVPATGSLHAFHNAELPGTSICALNHLIKTRHPQVQYEWVASSYAPADKDSAALDDMFGIYAATKEHWLMTPTNNGDMTDIKNILDIEKKIGGSMDLYTHDAGIDVSDNYNIQEEANARLHLGCALMGFLVLKPGGIFIGKQYTLFETLTMNLIAIYATLFTEFYLSKPMTSGYGNSEVYLIGKGFKGLPDNIRKLLTDRLENFSMAPMLTELSADVLNAQVTFAKRLALAQVENIHVSIDMYESVLGPVSYKTVDEIFPVLRKLQEDIKPAQLDFSRAWIRMFPIGVIRRSDQIPFKK